MPVNVDPETRRQIILEAAANGEVLIADDLRKVGASALIERGAVVMQQVANGQAPLSQLAMGLDFVLQGVEQITAVTGFEPPPPSDGFFPQRDGMVQAVRALLQGKKVAGAQLYNVKIDAAQTRSEADQVEVLQGLAGLLTGTLGRMGGRLYPMESSLYKKLQGGWEILGPVFNQERRVPLWAEDLQGYMTGRYKKAAATRQHNQEMKAAWGAQSEENVRKKEEEKIRARTIEDWTNSFVRRLEMERRGEDRDEG